MSSSYVFSLPSEALPDPRLVAWLEHFTKLAARACQTPFAAIALADQAGKWSHHVTTEGTALSDQLLFLHRLAMRGKNVLVVDGTQAGAEGEFPVTGEGEILKCYAGMPLFMVDGSVAGVLAVMGPGQPSEAQKELLASLAQHLVWHFAFRHSYRLPCSVAEQSGAIARKAVRHGSSSLEQRFEQVADILPHIVWSATAGGLIDYVNQTAIDFTGIAFDYATQNWMNYLHPADAETCLAGWRDSVATGNAYYAEYRLFHAASASYRWHAASAKPVRDDAGAILKWYGTCIDIHDSKIAHAKVQQQAVMLENMADGMCLLDHEWRILQLDTGGELSTERHMEGVLGQVIWEAFPALRNTRFYDEYQRAVAEQRHVRFEEFYAPLHCWFYVYAYPVSEGLAIYFRDITARRDAEHEAAQTTRALRILSRCNAALATIDEESRLLREICLIALDAGDYRAAWIGYAQDDAALTILPVAHAGSDEVRNFLAEIRLSWSEDTPFGRGPAGKTIRSGKAIVLADMERDPAFAPWRTSARHGGYRSGVYLPLRQKGRTFGVLALYHHGIRRAAEAEVGLLQELADNLAVGIQHLRLQQRQQQMQDAVVRIAAAVSAGSGDEFFAQLASAVAEAVGADAAFVCRLLPGQPASMQTLAGWFDGKPVENFTYALQGVPCAAVIENRVHVIPDNISELYPDVQEFADWQMRGFAGQRLDDAFGKPLGILFVLFRQPISELSDFVMSALKIFGTRAAAELERKEADSRIRNQASLLDKAKDAIVVRDTEQRILFWNKGAERLFGWTSDEVLGRPAHDFLYPELDLFRKNSALLLRHGQWSGEQIACRRDGTLVPVETSMTLVMDDEGRPQSVFSIDTDITERKAAERQIQHLAFYDQLTGLPNRQLMWDRLQHALLMSARSSKLGAVVFIDLDNFKMLNDTYGHDKGDLLLQQVAQRLLTNVRESDTAARLGGDEFVVVLEDLGTDALAAAEQAEMVAHKIHATLEQAYQLGSNEYISTPSIGIALFDGAVDGVEEVLKKADLAMYRAKSAGRNAVRFFDPAIQEAVNSHSALEADFRDSLREGLFHLCYQPQISSGNMMVGMEALARWRHPVRGDVPPGLFIPLAEEAGLISAFGEWVLRAACAQLAEWARNPEMARLTLSVNISGRQFRHSNFVRQVLDALHASGANPQRLKLELTESVLVEDVEEAIRKMNALRAIGIAFSLDDFGTGYSSLSYLSRLPLEQLKIDQSFISDVPSNANNSAIVQTIIALGRNLGMEVVAEGVETTRQLQFLAENGCRAYQGYLFSRPVSAAEVQALIRHNWLPV